VAETRDPVARVVMRQVVLPTILATPVWVWLLPAFLRGWSALGEVPDLSGILFGTLLTLAGLLAIGLPIASFIMRKRFPTAITVLALLVAGAVGGAVFASVFFAAVAALGGGGWRGLPFMSALGLLPGLVVALAWTLINVSRLKPVGSGEENGNG